ncbi:hypothetical protein ACTFIZ_009511 [Dictyostelium cf. discoideum]
MLNPQQPQQQQQQQQQQRQQQKQQQLLKTQKEYYKEYIREKGTTCVALKTVLNNMDIGICFDEIVKIDSKKRILLEIQTVFLSRNNYHSIASVLFFFNYRYHRIIFDPNGDEEMYYGNNWYSIKCPLKTKNYIFDHKTQTTGLCTPEYQLFPFFFL